MAYRLFVGIDLPQVIRERLHALQSGVRGARWVAPENLHLSLRFIGEVDGGQAQDIHDALSALSGAPFSLALDEAGAFASGKRARVVYVSVTPAAPVAALKARVDALLAGAGLGPEGRRFTPHITLARLKGARSREVGTRVAEMAPEVTGSFEVSEVVLFRSHLAAAGAQYTREAAYPLEGD
jgi:2'-5' RNA ligase